MFEECKLVLQWLGLRINRGNTIFFMPYYDLIGKLRLSWAIIGLIIYSKVGLI